MILRAAALALTLAACGGGGPVPKGQFHVAWSFELANGATADCGTAGIATIIAVADEGTDVESVPTNFECGLYEGVTQPIPLAAYMIKLEAYKPSGNFETATAYMTGTLEVEDATVDVVPFLILIPAP